MKKTRSSIKIISVSIVLFVFFSLYSNINIVNANGVGPSQSFNTNFILEEYSKFNESIQNENSINIPLPSSSWSLQDIELNFTDIKFGNENITIEDKHYGNSYWMNYQNEPQKLLGVGVQIQLNISTTIYGVYIYANMTATTSEIIQLQLRGYDPVKGAPNNTIYGSTNFNVNTTARWYFQNFSTPISLPIGNYYLVLNGTNISTTTTDFYWYYNDLDPKNPNLNVSTYKNPPWTDGATGIVPLYQLVQRVNVPLYPEEINMTVNINDHEYSISNEMPLYFIRSAILMTKIVGISKSLIWVKSNRLRFKFSTSLMTTATSGKSLSFLFKSNSITTFSSRDDAFKL